CYPLGYAARADRQAPSPNAAFRVRPLLLAGGTDSPPSPGLAGEGTGLRAFPCLSGRANRRREPPGGRAGRPVGGPAADSPTRRQEDRRGGGRVPGAGPTAIRTRADSLPSR